MKQNLIIIASLALLTACGGSDTTQHSSNADTSEKAYDPTVGEGNLAM